MTFLHVPLVISKSDTVVLRILDLAAAFNTVDHPILQSHLKHSAPQTTSLKSPKQDVKPMETRISE